MSAAPLLVFDFDGVLADGMDEYWWSARHAALRLTAAEPAGAPPLPSRVPAAFVRLRPRIHRGWEMVLVAAELGRPGFDLDAVLDDYPRMVEEALARRRWHPSLLQQTLETVRSEAIAADRQAWIGRHRFYPGVVERLRRLESEGAAWSVLTTKGGAFAAELLAAAGLAPASLHGHEDGTKPEVLLRLAAAGRPLWFVEDRRPTLERVRITRGLEQVRCYLAAWGYLGPGDAEGLAAAGIRWLEPDRFAAPLAEWP